MAVREKMRWKDEKFSVVRKENQPAPESVLEFITCTCHKSNCTNFYKCRLLSMECTDVFKCRGKMSKVIMMRLKRTMKMIMLTTELKIFDADYQTLYLSYLADIFGCINSGTSLSAKTIQSYLSKRYLRVYIPGVSPMFIFQALADFQSQA